ncbi:MAG: thioredoxin family protein [Lentisphaeria bacterium]|nr:thioredoxin family protein [Lentisphaeria bacterium]
MKHFELILAAAICGSLCAGAALNAADTKPAKEAKEAAKKSEVVWLTDLEAAKKQAAKENKPILMFFTGSDWCGWCKKLHEDVLDKDEFQELAKDGLVLLELDFPRTKEQSDALKKQNDELNKKFKIDGYPTMVLVAPDGEKELDRTVGYDKELVKKLKKTVKKSTVDAKKKSGEDAADKEAGEAGEGLAWLTDFEAAKKQAAAENKPILMFFTGSDWCIWCMRLHEDVLDKDEFRDFSKKLVLLELDFPNNIPQSDALKKQNAELAEKFKADGYPCTVVLASDGETRLGTISGYSRQYIDKIQDILDGKGKPVTMDELQEKFAYLPDTLLEYKDLKLTRESVIQEIADEVLPLGISLSDCDDITPETIGIIIQQKLDEAIMLDMAIDAGFKPSAQLVKDAITSEVNEFPAEQKEALEEALKQQGSSLDELIGSLADDKEHQESAAIKLFINDYAEKAAKKDIDEEALKDHYEANRTQFPGEYEAERAKVLDTLVKAKAPAKARELDKEIETIRKTVKYWKPEN